MSTYYYELRSPFVNVEKIVKDNKIKVVLHTDDGECGSLTFNSKDDFCEFMDMITEDRPTCTTYYGGKDKGTRFKILKEPLSDILISDKFEIMRIGDLVGDLGE